MADGGLDVRPLPSPQASPASGRGSDSEDVSVAINSSRRALEAGDAGAAARWLDRAWRLKPGDPVSRLRLISLCLQLADARAQPLLTDLIADYPDFREPRFGLASLFLQRADADAAATVLNELLGRMSPGSDPSLHQVATRVAVAARSPGWIGASSSGVVTLAALWAWNQGRLIVQLDGEPLDLTWIAMPGSAVRTAELPPSWIERETLTARYQGHPLLGNPVSLAGLRRVDGVVEALPDGTVEGWAALPGDPDPIPKLLVFRESRPDEAETILATDETVALQAEWGAIAPRGFRFDPHKLRGTGAVHVIGSDGRPLLGSPCYPVDEWRAAAASAGAVARLFPVRTPGRRTAEPVQPIRWQPMPVSPGQIMVARGRLQRRTDLPRRAPVDVVVPVYKGAAGFRACLRSLARGLPPAARIVVVDDATPDRRLRALLDEAVAKREIVLLRHQANRGFPAAANTGFRHALAQGVSGRDVVLLNSDTLVPRGSLEALADIAYSAPDIGSCTPFSNDASILSYPRLDAANPAADLKDTGRLNAMFRKANGTASEELPSAVGFCVFIRRDCLAEVGLFREDVFAQGYGEENDWSIRAARLGWRHMAALGTFVSHRAGTSFGRARAALMQRNTRVLNRLHPGYDSFTDEFIRRDPLAPARRKVDALRWAEAREAAAAVVLVTHDLGGGVERHVRDRAAALRRGGLRPIVIRPAKRGGGAGESGACAVSDGTGNEFPNLRYALPREIDELAALLQPDKPTHLELHHLYGHSQLIRPLAIRLRVPYDVFIHDSALFCPRLNLCNGTHAYCGEPVAVEDCSACIADAGSRLDEEIGVAELRARSGELLKSARNVIGPTEDTARRINRYFPAIMPLVQRWEPDPPQNSGAGPTAAEGDDTPIKICVLGAITEDKGYSVILNCARDAARRRLPLTFVLVGYTDDDARLLETGNVFVTGRYEENELPALIEAQGARLGFIPSQCPESWCYALTSLWKAELTVAAFSLGAQAERIRRTGRGFLLPLGLSAARINDALLRYCREGASRIAAQSDMAQVAAAMHGD